MNVKRISAMTLSLVMVATGCSVTVPEETTEPSETKLPTRAEYEPIRAQDDFYGYINLETLKNLEIEYGEGVAGGFANIDSNEQLLDIIHTLQNSGETYPIGSCEQITLDYFNSVLAFIDNDSYQAEAAQTIEDEIIAIKSISSLDEYKAKYPELLNKYGISPLITLSVDKDNYNPDEYSFIYYQLPNIVDISLEDLADNANNASDYESSFKTILISTGMSKDEAKDLVKSTLYLVIDIARASDIDKLKGLSDFDIPTYMTEEEINSILTNQSMAEFEQMVNITNNPYDGWQVYDPEQLAAVDNILTEDNLEELKALTLYDFINSYGNYIADNHSELEVLFPDTHDNSEDLALAELSKDIPMVLSDLYTKYVYTEEMDKELSAMCDEIIESYNELISNADWLTQESRELLLKKLNNISFITGRFVLDNMELKPEFNDMLEDNYFKTMLNINEYNIEDIRSNIGQPFNKLEVGMTMQTVNACYNPCNTVTITVAILNEPFFDASANHFSNLGGLGAVIAHEIGHAFDSNLIKYDADGVYNPEWLSSSDVEALEARNQEAIDYFEDNFTVFNVYTVDGEKTLGENYADLSGMECITSICKTDDDFVQLFENYGRIWCMLEKETYAIELLSLDQHGPNILRVNAILSSTDDFYRIYDVKEGDGMYIAPENRISRWKK
ncbi:MAG: M13 family metallopeptidase [Clostridia bacterium]|nr:M13 family metallopeptidase [Clostridia bacterium]